MPRYKHFVCETESTWSQHGKSHAQWSWLEHAVLAVDREEISREGGSLGPSQRLSRCMWVCKESEEAVYLQSCLWSLATWSKM